MQTFDFGGNITTTAGAFTGTSAFGGNTTHATTNAVNYCIGGKAYVKAAITGGTTPTTDGSTGAAITLTANNGTVVVWALDASGNVKVYKGETQALDAAGNFVDAPEFPAVPDTVAAFAYHVIKAGSTTSGTWTFGSSNWNATGLSHSAKDVFFLPVRPQVA